jgi:iron complex outermembrane receptor protein
MTRQPRSQALHPLAAAAALACAAGALAPAAVWAQSADTEIVVTGSRIRGAPAVGAPVQAVSRDEIENSAGINTAQILQAVPQIYNLGISENSRGQGGSGNITYGSGINLRGIGPFATLVLVNGHRVVGQGTQSATVDPSIIPALMLERVEVVADGASAVYGSDAVAGVANLILRRNEPGGQASARFGIADGYNERQLGALLGRKWSGGQFTLAAEHTYRTALSGSDRDFFRGDLRDDGGGDFRGTQCSPGNIVISGVSYAIPPGGVTAASAADLKPGTSNRCDNLKVMDLIPRQERNSLAFTFNHALTKDLSLWADGLATRRDYRFRPQALASNLNVPSTNPYYVRPPGAPAGTSETVAYSFIDELPQNTANGYSKTAEITFGADLALPGQWKASAAYTYGQNEDQSTTLHALNNGAVAAALRATDPALALNVFGSGRNSEALLASISNNIAISPGRTDFQNLSLKADGPLFQLPGGALRAALGLEWQDYETQGGQTTGTLAAPVFGEVTLKRQVESAYAELLVPLVGEKNALPGVQRLDFSAAMRLDRYSDVGNTDNPKLGLNWSPTKGLLVRASYGESFRAPGLTQIRGFTNGGRGGLFVQNYSDPTDGGRLRVGVALSAANPDLKPETAKTKTLGFDWDLPLARKTRLSLTWFDITYDNQIVNYLPDLTVLNREASFAGTGIIQRNPSAELVAQLIATYPTNAVLPTTWTLFVDGRNKNLSKSITQGVDFGFNSRIPGGSAGEFALGLTGTLFTKYEVAVTPASPLVDQLNTIFNPIKFKARATAGWSRGAWQTNLVVNHVGSYRNTLSNPQHDVRAHTTFDLRLGLALGELTGSPALRDTTIALGVYNAFDRKPPFVNIAQSQNGGGGFDPTAASPIGRLWALAFDKRF